MATLKASYPVWPKVIPAARCQTSCSLHDYDVKPPNATFYEGRGQYDDKFSFSYLNKGKALKNSTPGKVAYILRIKRFPIDVIKFERTQIPFFSGVFTAVVFVVA